ncbi:MAG TPA: hypothetical protein VJB87_03615 [Candidatus Nanoarchaeia archaeon]|nr:hypothetical protein [Candidatus Nanoarchaeia archaeon]
MTDAVTPPPRCRDLKGTSELATLVPGDCVPLHCGSLNVFVTYAGHVPEERTITFVEIPRGHRKGTGDLALPIWNVPQDVFVHGGSIHPDYRCRNQLVPVGTVHYAHYRGLIDLLEP